MGLPFTASWKSWVSRYPARFSLCRLVTTAGRSCPQPVSLHLKEEWVVLNHLYHKRQCQKRENNPSPPPHWLPHHLYHPEKGGKEDRPMSLLQTSHLIQTGELKLSVRLHLCPLDRRWDFSFFFSPPSQSLTALSFASHKRLWAIQPVIATIKENNRKKIVKYSKCQV